MDISKGKWTDNNSQFISNKSSSGTVSIRHFAIVTMTSALFKNN